MKSQHGCGICDHRLTEKEAGAILDRLPGLRFGVVGDFCLDAYLAVNPEAGEVSLETRLVTQPVSEQRYSLGGAGNVAANLRALGAGSVEAFGVTGPDPFGAEMRRTMGQWGIGTAGLLVQPRRWHTHTYTKILVEGREQPRLDYGNFNELEPDTARQLLGAVERALPGLNVLIINQQVLRGVHTAEFRSELAGLVARHPGTTCLLDSRDHSDEYGSVYRKLNAREGAAIGKGGGAGNEEEVPDREARAIALRLFQRWGRPLFLTRGSRGCLVVDESGCREVPGLLILGRTDTVGAGDSLLAGLGAALAAGRPPLEAALFGTLAAGVTVQKLFQTGTASAQEVRAMAREHSFRHAPELAALPQRARHHRNTEIEVVGALPRGRQILAAIFDHDGTVSTLRQGWEEVMAPMMARSILGERWRTADPSTHRRVAEQVREYIQATTGVQTLVQMRGLVEMVREAGHVPAEEILDEKGYKEIYNRELMQRIEARAVKLRRGELGTEDFTLKGAVGFLRLLHERGVPLYLASGTDQADVEREAELLGYAPLFGGRIYGAIGDLTHEPKKKVLERILAQMLRPQMLRAQHLPPAQAGVFVTFGDGPVEIQETRKAGGIAVGVASDELRRFGLNIAKRSRVIEAGADLVVPDFSQAQALAALLLGQRRGGQRAARGPGDGQS
ncbi:MAG: HAD family hydrolase [Spirochaetales bacterium]|nr:HAD family hydrolase [Spirochaetales bacterium]